ncbi:unnamed protein product [Pleuronectes platessa]|uniref:Uncharacterized protein n=1 Tax=Pleuronectes platessa TaxID=8262 RepID=A0A9N7TPB5_PLEPL|nr:unnamed protein product [Pleuronectes platessa]
MSLSIVKVDYPWGLQLARTAPASNGPPSAPATDTAPRSKRKKAPRTTDAVRHSGIGPPPPKKRRGVPHAESPAAWRGGRLLPQPRHLPSGLTTNTNDIAPRASHAPCHNPPAQGEEGKEKTTTKQQPYLKTSPSHHGGVFSLEWRMESQGSLSRPLIGSSGLLAVAWVTQKTKVPVGLRVV